MSFDIPQPKKMAPEMTVEERRALAPLDLLARYVMPKLFDRQNELEWKVQKLAFELGEAVAALNNMKDVNTRILSAIGKTDNATTDKVKRGRRSRKKEVVVDVTDSEPAQPEIKKVSIQGTVGFGRIARYDSENDGWLPKLIGGVEVNAAVVKKVVAGKGDYSTEVVAYVMDLDDDERAVLCGMFPEDK